MSQLPHTPDAEALRAQARQADARIAAIEKTIAELEAAQSGVRNYGPEGQTTPDRQIHFETVRCIGCCGMAPAMVVDGKTCGHVKTSDVAGHLADLRAKKETAA